MIYIHECHLHVCNAMPWVFNMVGLKGLTFSSEG